MKRNVWICTLILTMVCLTFVLCGSDAQGNIDDIVMDAPNTLNALEAEYSLDAAKSILGNEDASGNVELLYNANDEAEYLLVTANEGGYVIFHRMTGSLMEAGEFGSSPYADQEGKEYYFGPSNYVVANAQGVKTDIMRGGDISRERLDEMHQNMSEIRSLIVERAEIKSYERMISLYGASKAGDQGEEKSKRNSVNGDWYTNPYDREVDIDAFIEIEHSDFYEGLITASEYGYNSHGSCKFVSTVLLLRYYDMFYAPSLIPNENIPEAWIQVCDSARDVLGQNAYGDTEYYDCSIDVTNDSIYEALHKFLIASETKIGFSIFGTHGYSVKRYNNGLPSCIDVDNSNIIALMDDDAFNRAKILIDGDNPVALQIAYNSNSGSGIHAVVAYGYLENDAGKYYKTHFGWPGNSYTSIVLPHYFVSTEINYLDIFDYHTTNNAHNCVNVGYISNQSVGCFGNEGHYYVADIDTHYCGCGLLESHGEQGEITSHNNQCYRTCEKCDFEYMISHIGYRYERYSIGKHYKICVNCGSVEEESHKMVQGAFGCILCGYGVGGNVSPKGVN